jgi:hypothetical protein
VPVAKIPLGIAMCINFWRNKHFKIRGEVTLGDLDEYTFWVEQVWDQSLQ